MLPCARVNFIHQKIFLAELDEEQAGWDLPAPGKAKLLSPAC